MRKLWLVFALARRRLDLTLVNMKVNLGVGRAVALSTHGFNEQFNVVTGVWLVNVTTGL